jgi:hypothetical protein
MGTLSPFFGAQLAHPVIGVHPRDGNPEDHNYCHQADDVSIHTVPRFLSRCPRMLEIAYSLRYGERRRKFRSFKAGF